MQRDVPGFTRAALPILAGQGVKAVTVGVNGGSAPPAVPHNTPFIWRDTLTQTDMLAMWRPGTLPEIYQTSTSSLATVHICSCIPFLTVWCFC